MVDGLVNGLSVDDLNEVICDFFFDDGEVVVVCIIVDGEMCLKLMFLNF